MPPIVIKLGGYQGPQSINTRAAARFGEVLLERLGDRVFFELVPDVLALGRGSGDLPNMVKAGELALCYISTIRFAPTIPEMTLLELPFVVRSRATAMKALLGPLGALYKQRMSERTPFRALGFWDNGFRHITLTGHFFGASAFVCTEAWYTALPAGVRAAVDAAAHAATTYQNQLAAAEDETILGLIDPRENEVARLSADEMDAFTRAVQPVRARHLKALDPRLFAYLQ